MTPRQVWSASARGRTFTEEYESVGIVHISTSLSSSGAAIQSSDVTPLRTTGLRVKKAISGAL